MTRALRFGLLVAGALATCLAVLWACVFLGLWLALHAPLMGMHGSTAARAVMAGIFVHDRERQR